MASDRTPTFVKTLHDSSPYYERLRKKRPAPTTAAPLTCEEHPFFEDLQALPEVIKSFYDELISTESDIFQECLVVCPALRTIIINSLFESVLRLEKFMIMVIPTNITEEVAEVTASAARMGVRVLVKLQQKEGI